MLDSSSSFVEVDEIFIEEGVIYFIIENFICLWENIYFLKFFY